MDLTTAVPVVTGANRGLGRRLVDALLERGAGKVYALAREPGAVRHDARVVPVAFDLTDAQSIARAAARATDATLLINNASTAAFAGPLDADPDAVRREMAVNYDGLYATIRAFVPVLERAADAHVVNVLSLLSLASTPPMAGYSASKAAAHSLTQALRPILGGRGITVHGVYPAGIDTEMAAGIDAPKTAPEVVAAGILAGLAVDQEDIFRDPNALAMSQMWFSDPKASSAPSRRRLAARERLTPLRSRGAGRWRARGSCEPRRRRAGSRARPRARRPRCRTRSGCRWPRRRGRSPGPTATPGS